MYVISTPVIIKKIVLFPFRETDLKLALLPPRLAASQNNPFPRRVPDVSVIGFAAPDRGSLTNVPLVAPVLKTINPPLCYYP